jgi:hypothetical protein
VKKITSIVLTAFILFSLASVSSLAENDMNVNVSDGDTVSGIFEFKIFCISSFKSRCFMAVPSCR